MNLHRYFLKVFSLTLLASTNAIFAYSQSNISIMGVILDSLNHPIPVATVVLFPDKHTAITSDKGHFEFDKLYEGTYHLEIIAVGYETLKQSIRLEKVDQILRIQLKTAKNSIQEVSVSRTADAKDNLIKSELAAMPIKIITRREIELMGSRRLDEVMKEQTGVAVVSDIASGSRSIGVQIQGFSSNYVMVLIDGQPMLGRNSGNFDLSRISVTNIERIEIIKGASSCLYGSDALGGAINIITRHGAVSKQLHSSLLYGSLNIIDAAIEGETPFANQRGNLILSGNYYRTDGFNTNGKYMNSGTTVAPYANYSLQGRSRYRISKNGTLGITARYAQRSSTMLSGWSEDLINENKQKDQDINLSGSYDHHFSDHFRTMTRYYFTRFHNEMVAEWVKQSQLISSDKFGQNVNRIEQQLAYSPATNLKFIGGLGGSIETMDDKKLYNIRNLNAAFTYLQTEYRLNEKIITTMGLRYDRTNVYNGQFSPSFGLQYQLHPTFLIKAGVGQGFKAPDYKMRYQIFYNPSANYLLVGTDQLSEAMDALEKAGELSSRNRYLINLIANKLKPEKSLSNNVGFVWNPNQRFNIEGTVFYHYIKNQINSISVGVGTKIGQIYTYRNLPKATNKGIELSANYKPVSNIMLSAGYQYLIAKDLSIIDSIKANRYPYNQPLYNPINGESIAPTTSSYWGIEDRSRHMLNLKVQYEIIPIGLTINVRGNIRGRYPFQEISGNQFIDKYDAFVPAHTLLNATLEKRLLRNKFTIKVIVDNALNYTHEYMPGQTGRVILAGLSYRWIKE